MKFFTKIVFVFYTCFATIPEMTLAGRIEAQPMKLELSARKDLLHVSDDLVFHLLNGQTAASLYPEGSLKMVYHTGNIAEVNAITSGNILPRSKLAISGVEVVTPFSVRQSEHGWTIQVTLKNTGPVKMSMPAQFPLLRVYQCPEVPLRGKALLHEATKMGNPGYICLRTHNGEIYPLSEIQNMQEDLGEYLDQHSANPFEQVVLPYSNEVGIIERQDEINLLEQPGRTRGLDDFLQLQWKPAYTPLPEKQRVLLQRTQEAVSIPPGTFGLVHPEGLGGTELPHGAARGLSSVSHDSAYHWQIYGEHTIEDPRKSPRQRSVTTQEWTKPQAMVVELYRTE